jgi:hypothetical protein
MALSKATALIGVCAAALIAAGSAFAEGDGWWWGGGSGGGDHGDRNGHGRDRGREHGQTVEVDKLSGPYHTITDGIRAAGYGGTVSVHPGEYSESLLITKPVTIVGKVDQTDPDNVVNLVTITPPGDIPCASIDVDGSGFVSLRQLNLTAGSEHVQHSCVELDSGYLSVKDSSITAPSYVATLLARGGHMSIENTTIQGGREGVLVATQSDNAGTFYIVGSRIMHNVTGIKVDGISQANIIDNDIHDNLSDGIVYFQGRGRVIGNDIYDNARAGLVLQNSPVSPTVKVNNIRHNRSAGIVIQPSTAESTPLPGGHGLPRSRGVICDNIISDNGGSGIDARESGLSPDCRNTLSGNGGEHRRRGGRDH